MDFPMIAPHFLTIWKHLEMDGEQQFRQKHTSNLTIFCCFGEKSGKMFLQFTKKL